MPKLKFHIEQVAICPTNAAAAITLLTEMGAVSWAKDHVVADGEVFGQLATNEADLSFNYDLMKGGNEFEVLDYTSGPNWMDCDERRNSVSHLGMHCTDDDLENWQEFFTERGIGVVQEVVTKSHTNPVIDGKRLYNYVIFGTKAILGVDLKFIVRLEPDQVHLD